ncbi:MAG: aryl-sulfate sulfotransferase [Myxococcota bacterium]
MIGGAAAWVLVACSGGGDDPTPPTAPVGDGPQVVAGPELVDPGPQVLLAAELHVDTDVPTTLEVRLQEDGASEIRVLRFAELAAAHRVPLVGFRAGSTHQVGVRLTDAEGEVVEAGPLPFDAGPGLEAPPQRDLLVADPARMEPGVTLMPAKLGDQAWILTLDDQAEIVYAQATSLSINSVTPTPSGDLVMVDGPDLRQVDLLGRTVRRWTAEPTEPTDVAVPFGDFHHDVFPLADGSVFALVYDHADVPEYPESYQDPFAYAPATIRNDAVVHVAADGTVLGHWAMLELLDPHHIGFDALGPDPSGALDWVHANAVIYDEATDEVTVSLRHQDAVVHFSAATGALQWILAAPDGWDEALQPYILQPTAPFVRHTHQHAIEFDPDGQTLRMFDNGNDRRNTPYVSSGQGREYSRILELRVDPVAMTVAPLGEFGQTSTGPLFATSLGNADRLPVTGDRLATFGTVPRVTEWTAEGEVVFDLELEPGGWRIDRALRRGSLYGPSVVETVEAAR